MKRGPRFKSPGTAGNGTTGVEPDRVLWNIAALQGDPISPRENIPAPDPPRTVEEQRALMQQTNQKRAKYTRNSSEIAKRRALGKAAFKLVMKGVPTEEIAASLNVTQGFVKLAVNRILDTLSPTEGERSRVRTLWQTRLEALVGTFFQRAAEGDSDALDALLKIADRIAKFVDAGYVEKGGAALAQVIIRMEPTSGAISPGRDEEELAGRASLTMLQAGRTLPRQLPRVARKGGAWSDLLTPVVDAEIIPCRAEAKADVRADAEEAEPAEGSSDASSTSTEPDQGV
jgi:hypothetical protein